MTDLTAQEFCFRAIEDLTALRKELEKAQAAAIEASDWPRVAQLHYNLMGLRQATECVMARAPNAASPTFMVGLTDAADLEDVVKRIGGLGVVVARVMIHLRVIEVKAPVHLRPALEELTGVKRVVLSERVYYLTPKE